MLVDLIGCSYQPLAAYLKALAVLRLVTQEDAAARGHWNERCFVLDSRFDEDGLVAFFLEDYEPTPTLAPWNGGSGFYPKDRKIGINAILGTTDARFATYRSDLERAAVIVSEASGLSDEDKRRTEILRRCRNELSDASVDWLDAAIAIASDETRAFAPILGTGGNEGRLDYTNNFMENLSNLLIAPDKKLPARELLRNALFGEHSAGLQPIAVGQYDPGRAGGFNQGEKIEAGSVANQWNAVLTLEGAAAWAGGIYRKQGVSYRSFLCSPFTVQASAVGYGSASSNDDARAEIWTPLWRKPARFAEIEALLREGRAAVDGKPAKTGLEFAEAAAMLGVDRGIDAFVRYSLLKRRGDSYIALPTGKFNVSYRSNADLVRNMTPFVEAAKRAAKGPTGELPNSWPPLARAIEEAMFQALLHERQDLLVEVLAAFGAMHKWLLLRHKQANWRAHLSDDWIRTTWETKPEVRIAAALAGLRHDDAGDLIHNVTPDGLHGCWVGRDLPARMLATLRRRTLDGGQSDRSPFSSKLLAKPADVVAFLERRVDDDLIEDLVFAFVQAKLPDGLNSKRWTDDVLRWPSYCALKQFFAWQTHLGGHAGDGEPRFRPHPGITGLLIGGRSGAAVEAGIQRLRIAGLRPILQSGKDSEDSITLGGALLIPVWGVGLMRRTIAAEPEMEEAEV